MQRAGVVLALLLGIGLLFSPGVDAEEMVYYAVHGGPPVTFDSEDPGQFAKLPGPPHAVATGTDPAKFGNLTFNITFQDVIGATGVGFDDAADGATRRATLLTVANYVNDVLNETTGATIDIDVAASQTDGTGFLASCGTLWFTAPNRYDGGFAWEHITTGTDPSGGNADMLLTVDFGYTWNTDFTAPAGGEFDLSSVLLHELTHALGFLGLTDDLGLSTISTSNPGVFALMTDYFLRGTGSVDLWDASFTFVGVVGDLIGNDMFFAGPLATAANGSNPKIYAPGTWASGSSLSHWDTPTFPNSVMKHAVSAGTTYRQYQAFEIAALQDIGFTNAADPGAPVPVEISEFKTE